MSRLPKGLDMIADIRHQGFKPKSLVFVWLDRNIQRPKLYRDVPLPLDVSVLPTDRISDLDFSPLVGLDVQILATEKNERLRELIRAISPHAAWLAVFTLVDGWLAYRHRGGEWS